MITYGTKVRQITTGLVGVALGSLSALNDLENLTSSLVLVDFGEGLTLGHCGFVDSVTGDRYIGTNTGWWEMRENLEEIPGQE